MLILQRRPGESIRIGEDIDISVMSVEGGRVRLAITAPADVTVLRSELIQVKAANRDSVMEQALPPELLNILGEALPGEHGAHVSAPIKPVFPHEHKQGGKTVRSEEKGGKTL